MKIITRPIHDPIRLTFIFVTLALVPLEAKEVKVMAKKLDSNLLTFLQNLKPMLDQQNNAKLVQNEGNRVNRTQEVPSIENKNRFPEMKSPVSGGTFHCRQNDTAAQSVCHEFCIHKSYDHGVCNENDGSCICTGLNGHTSQVKIFSPPNQKHRRSKPIRVIGANRVRSGIGKFSCDNTPEENSICHVYCLSVKNMTESACSQDHKSCLCFSNQFIQKNTKRLRQREKRSLVDVDLESALQETVVLPSTGRGHMMPRKKQRPSPFGPMRRRPPFGAGQMGLLGCTPFSCVNNCPPRCDSLCSVNMQCFCSCAEDEVFYEYYDTPSFYTDTLAFY